MFGSICDDDNIDDNNWEFYHQNGVLQSLPALRHRWRKRKTTLEINIFNLIKINGLF